MSHDGEAKPLALLLPLAGIAQDIKLNVKQLLELQAVLSTTQLFRIVRKMHAAKGFIERHEVVLLHEIVG